MLLVMVDSLSTSTLKSCSTDLYLRYKQRKGKSMSEKWNNLSTHTHEKKLVTCTKAKQRSWFLSSYRRVKLSNQVLLRVASSNGKAQHRQHRT